MPQADVTTKVTITLLYELINSVRYGNAAFKQMGLGQSTMNDLASMNLSEIQTVADTPFVTLTLDTRTLNMSIQRTLRRRNRDNLLDQAITLGASRSVMKTYANMPHKEFNKRRERLELSVNRSRPTMLSNVEYDRLATLHSKYAQSNSFENKLDHLRCLIYLSESMSIDINRIYQYFYSEHQSLFLTEQYQHEA